MGLAAVVPYIPEIVSGITAAVVGYGAVENAQAQSSMGHYQAAVALNNQKVANNNAVAATNTGTEMEMAKRTQTADVIGAQRAGLSGSGFDLNSGSPLRLQTDTAKLGEMDAMAIRSNAARASYGYKTQGLDYGTQANLDMAQARNAETSGYINAASSIMGNTATIGKKYGW